MHPFPALLCRHTRRAALLSTLLLSPLFLSACAHQKNNEKYKHLSAAEIYQQGQTQLDKKRYGSAAEDFEALEAHHPYGDYAEKGLLALTYAYYKQGEADSAIAAADRFIQLYPNHPEVDYAYYLKGMVRSEQNTSFVYRYFPVDRSLRDKTTAEQAFDDFGFLVQHFPHSQYAAEAKQRQIALRNQLANHELHIAEYYQRRKAYVAVADRANYILQHFHQTPALLPALEMLRNAYEEMDMPALAEDTQKLIDSNQANIS